MLDFRKELIHYQFGEQRFRLWQPLPADIFQLKQQMDDSAPLYWARTWPSALVLSQFLTQHPVWIKNKWVLELGAGLGLLSLVAARYARHVHCTDIAADAMILAAASATENGIDNMTCEAISWTKLPGSLEPEVVLMSDVNYDPALFPALRQVFLDCLQRGSTILLASPQRLMAKPFIQSLSSFIIHQETVAQPADPGTPLSIFILRSSATGMV